MLLPKFELHEPSTLQDALELLAELGGNAKKVLAGGTDLLVRMKLKIDKPAHVISLARVPGLAEITPRNSHGVTIGGAVTAAALSCNELLNDRFLPLPRQRVGSVHPLFATGHHRRESRQRPSGG